MFNGIGEDNGEMIMKVILIEIERNTLEIFVDQLGGLQFRVKSIFLPSY